MKVLTKFKLIIILIIAIFLSIIILLLTNNSIFSPKNDSEPYQTIGIIQSINEDQISFINSDSTEIININNNQISTINIFDPYTHKNIPSALIDLSKDDKIVINCPSLCDITKTPPLSFIGVVQEVTDNKVFIMSNKSVYSFSLTDKTIYIDPAKNAIAKSSILPNNIVFIYSDYTATTNQTEDIPTASIQILQ